MIVGLVVIFGAVVGLICYSIKGSGFGLWWDVILGIAGSIISSFVMTAAYLLNNVGKADVIGLNWYSVTIGTIGAVTVIYGAWLYNRANPFSDKYRPRIKKIA
jgi:uncharacterized membrane protein YeaQ/YmgE (transglycosylase-associated protein family)